MIDITYEIDIERDVDFVFRNIFKKDVYDIWAKAFNPVTRYEGEIIKDGEVKFFYDDGNYMNSKITKYVENQVIEVTFVSKKDDDVEEVFDDKIVQSYSFSSITPSKTHIIVKLKVTEDIEKIMKEMWDIAVDKLKNALEVTKI